MNDGAPRTAWYGLAPAIWVLVAACGGGDTGGPADTDAPFDVLADAEDVVLDALDTVSVRADTVDAEVDAAEDALDVEEDVPAPVDAVDVGPDVTEDVGPHPGRVIFRTACRRVFASDARPR